MITVLCGLSVLYPNPRASLPNEKGVFCLIAVPRRLFYQRRQRDRSPFEPLNGHAAREWLYGAVPTGVLVQSDKQLRWMCCGDGLSIKKSRGWGGQRVTPPRLWDPSVVFAQAIFDYENSHLQRNPRKTKQL